MKQKIQAALRKLHPRRIPAIAQTLLRDESIAGKLIIVAAIISMIVVNSPLVNIYSDFWHLPLSVGVGSWTISMDLRHWVNEALMAFFFLVVGLEIKRELVHGRLRDRQAALLPVAAAIGGMVVPALIYFAFNPVGPTVQGWGIPMATDIAFAVGVLALLGSRVPINLKLFLLTLAIVDDIGAITVIALFYAEIIHYGFLTLSALIVLGLWLARNWLSSRLVLFIIIGIVLWLTTHLSGIHASIVGAVLGLLAPHAVREGRRSIPEHLERAVLPLSTFIALPIFAFANAGFAFSLAALGHAGSASVFSGIVLGLVLGKTLGIAGAVWCAVRFTRADLPEGVRWPHIIGIGLIAGIGFTVSLFITELAFKGDPALIEAAKLGVFIASVASAVLGLTLLRFVGRKSNSWD